MWTVKAWTRAQRSTRSRPSRSCGAGWCTKRSFPSARPASPNCNSRCTEDVVARMESRGVERLFTHQAAAIDRLRTGTSVVVATGTASGKSLCYQLPIVDSVVAGRRDTALLIFPTKALAQDQLRALRSWLVPGLRAVTYDGDTARRRPRVGAQERERAC